MEPEIKKRICPDDLTEMVEMFSGSLTPEGELAKNWYCPRHSNETRCVTSVGTFALHSWEYLGGFWTFRYKCRRCHSTKTESNDGYY